MCVARSSDFCHCWVDIDEIHVKILAGNADISRFHGGDEGATVKIVRFATVRSQILIAFCKISGEFWVVFHFIKER